MTRIEPSKDEVGRVGYFGPDADGDYIVDILGSDLSFAVADEEKAQRIVAALSSLRPSSDAITQGMIEAGGNAWMELTVSGDRYTSEDIIRAIYTAMRNAPGSDAA